MKATELRIGNLVNIDNEKWHRKLTVEKTLLKVAGVSMSSDGFSIQMNTMDIAKQDVSPFISQLIQYIMPIPLTEKWLDKTPPTIDGCETSFHEHFADETIWFLHIGHEFAVQIKYVHQLQNLIFALTGEELLIK